MLVFNNSFALIFSQLLRWTEKRSISYLFRLNNFCWMKTLLYSKIQLFFASFLYIYIYIQKFQKVNIMRQQNFYCIIFSERFESSRKVRKFSQTYVLERSRHQLKDKWNRACNFLHLKYLLDNLLLNVFMQNPLSKLVKKSSMNENMIFIAWEHVSEKLFREVTGSRVSDHYARNTYLKVFLKITVQWI